MKFSILWEEFRLPLRNFIRKRIPNEQDTEDILQEVFFKIHSNIDGLQDDNKIHAWIYRITQNAIVDYYRKQNKKSIEIMEFTENLVNGQKDDLSSSGEIALCLKAMINQLPEKYKQAITITEFQLHPFIIPCVLIYE